MSEHRTAVEGAHPDGERLSEYFTIVAAIGDLLDEFGRPAPGHSDEYRRLRDRKTELRRALRENAPEYERTDIEATLDAAFVDQ